MRALRPLRTGSICLFASITLALAAGTLGVSSGPAGSELARKALGPHIFDRYVELKRKEWDEYRVQLTDWEMKKYLAVL